MDQSALKAFIFSVLSLANMGMVTYYLTKESYNSYEVALHLVLSIALFVSALLFLMDTRKRVKEM